MLTKRLLWDINGLQIEGEDYLDLDVTDSFAHDILEHGPEFAKNPYLNEISAIGAVLYHREDAYHGKLNTPANYLYNDVHPLLENVHTYPVPHIPLWCEEYFDPYLSSFEPNEIPFVAYIMYQGFARAESIDTRYGYQTFSSTYELLKELTPAVALLKCNFAVNVDFSQHKVSLEFLDAY